jgi:hypothetical protein
MLHVATVVALALCGCGGPSIAPSSGRAGSALAAALDAWKAGAPCGPVAGQAPPVIAVDSAWQSGRSLASYEILGPVAGADPPRLRARLALAAPDATEEVVYVLVGADPLYVYREADFGRMMNMDNNPAGTGPAG